MTGGVALSVRERERESARESGPHGLVLLGEQGRRRGSRPALPILFFFFKNVNSGGFSLFQ
jgi:hypothetical protein